jgi:sugar phosphate isomerase/epimerase
MLAEITAPKGIIVLLESLGPTVFNVIHSIPESIEYAKVVGKSNVGTFLDYRWFVDRNHPYQMIEDYGLHIRHVHIDNPDLPFPNRQVPRVNDGHNYSRLFQTLQKIYYEGILSIEASTFSDYPQDLNDGLEFFAAYGIERRKAIN